MIPTRNDKHVPEVTALLIEQFRNGGLNEKLLATYVRRLQDVEDFYWQIIDLRVLDAAQGVQLNVLGRLVGEPRLARDDIAFRKAIKLRIRVNRSKGRTLDVIDVAKLAAETSPVRYIDYRHLSFEVDMTAVAGERSIATALSQTRAASSYGHLTASDLPEAELLMLDDAVSPVAGYQTFGDAVTGQGRLAAAAYGLPTDYAGILIQGAPVVEPPRVDWLEPTSGVAGNTVVLHGAFLTGATSVDVVDFFPVGSMPVTSFSVINDARSQCVMPPHAAGSVALRVTTPGGTSSKNFQYVGFSPLTVAGLNVWFDASVCTVSGGIVTALPDQSGNGRNATILAGQEPGYTATNPGYTKPTIDFVAGTTDAVQVLVHGLTTGPFTMIVVGHGANYVVQDANGNTVLDCAAGTTWRMSSNAFGNIVSGGGPTSTPAVVAAVYNGASSRIYKSKRTPVTGNAGPLPTMTGLRMNLGNGASPSGAACLNGSIAQFLIYQGALSQVDVEYLVNGFGALHGITIAP